MKLPVPTGAIVKTEEVASLQYFGEMLRKFAPILQITKAGEYNSLSELQAALTDNGVEFQTDSFKNTGLSE